MEGGQGLQGLTGASWVLACGSPWGLFVLCGVDGYLGVTRGRRPGLWLHLPTRLSGHRQPRWAFSREAQQPQPQVPTVTLLFTTRVGFKGVFFSV